jgi:hypothetical protein
MVEITALFLAMLSILSEKGIITNQEEADLIEIKENFINNTPYKKGTEIVLASMIEEYFENKKKVSK